MINFTESKSEMGLREGGNGVLLINRHKVSIKQDEYALEICCTNIVHIVNNILYM